MHASGIHTIISDTKHVGLYVGLHATVSHFQHNNILAVVSIFVLRGFAKHKARMKSVSSLSSLFCI